MLTIAKIRDGGAAARYFEGQSRSDRQVDPATGTVAYFAESGEPPGRWFGSEPFGIDSGSIARAGQLQRLLEGRHPLGKDNALLVQSGREHRPGWDLTFSASKSVSATWAIADAELRAQIEQAHDQAVRTALAYLDEHAGWTRRGHGGTERERIHLVGITYQHSTSREDDPHLHSHAIVANTAKREDGSWGSIDSHDLYVHRLATGSLYQAELARGLQRLGFDLERGQGGTVEVRGVPREVLARWSTRHEQMATHGQSREAEAAWAKGRPRKEHVHRPSLFSRWVAEAATMGWTRGGIEALRRGLGRAPDAQIDMKAVVRSLTEKDSVFGRADLVRALAVASYGHAEAAQIKARAEEMLAHAGRSGSPLVRIGYDRDGEGIYSTRQHLKVERRMLHDMSRLASPVRGRAARARAVDDAMFAARARGTALSEEQRTALQVAVGGSRLVTVRGLAGAGKTTTMRAVRDAYEASGYRVIGLTTSNSAARILESEADIHSTSVAMFLTHHDLAKAQAYRRRQLAAWAGREAGRWALDRLLGRRHYWHGPPPARRSPWALDSRTVLVVDEASMVDTAALQKIVAGVRRSGGKLVLVGDDHQLSAVSAGGGFSAAREIARTAGADAELTDIRRQRTAWQREATVALSEGRVDEALKSYEAQGRVHVGEDRDLVRQMVAQWAADRRDHSGETQVMVASTNAQAAIANQLAQAALREEGILGERVIAGAETVKHGRVDLHVGDEIVFRAKPQEPVLKQAMPTVINGSTGRVAGLDSCGRVLVDLDGPEHQRVVLDTARYTSWHLAYASTVHRSQGSTVSRSYYLISSRDGVEAAYVGMSRHREDMHLFIDRLLYDTVQTARSRTKAVTDAAHEARDRLLEQVARRMSRSQTKILAHHHQRTHDQARSH